MPAKKRAYSPAKVAKKEAHQRIGYITRALCSNSFSTGWSGRAGHALEGEGEVFAGVEDGKIFEMLAEAAPESLGIPKSQRDAYQSSFVEMIGLALDAENKLLTKAVNASSDEASKAEKAKADSEAKATALEASLEAKKADITAKQEKLTADKEALKTAEGATQEAKKAKAADDARVEELGKKKAAFEQAGADLATLKDSPPADGQAKRKLCGHVLKTLETLSEEDIEAALSAAIPLSLKAPADKRGPFDLAIFDHVLSRLGAELAKYQAIQPSAEAAAALASAESALEAAKATVAASEEALKTAETEEAEMKKEKKNTSQESKHLIHEVKVTTEEHEKRHKVLTHFTEVRGYFEAQKDFEVPVEPEEAAAPAPVAEAAPAPA